MTTHRTKVTARRKTGKRALRLPPDFALEHEARARHGCDWLVGVDEVGRGPLAGPVVAAAVALPNPVPDDLYGLDDSKKLTAAQREHYAALLLHCAEVGIGMASCAEIEQINIHHASHLAMRRAIAHLPRRPYLALIDGKALPVLSCRAEAIIGGDGRCPSIAAASIVAKVTRDRLMARLARDWPGYGWERNAGYPTPAHRAAVERLGLTPHHRKTFSLCMVAQLESH